MGGLPWSLLKGLDLPTAMCSAQAYALLQQMGETGYQGYPENMSKIKQHISGLAACVNKPE